MKKIAQLFFLLASFPGLAQSLAPKPELPPIEESSTPTIGYDSVDEALAAVRANPRARVLADWDWLTIQVGKAGEPDYALWAFSKPSHPSHPSAVKRTISMREGRVVVDMDVKCDAESAACEDMIRVFQLGNLKLQNALNKH